MNEVSQIAPVPTERSLILAGVDAFERGLDLTPSQRAAMLRWIHILDAGVAAKVALAAPPLLRLVASNDLKPVDAGAADIGDRDRGADGRCENALDGFLV